MPCGGGGYVDAAYEALGEQLDSYDSLEDAETIYVNFSYTADFLFFSNTFVGLGVCLSREPGQSWTAVTPNLVSPTDAVSTDANGRTDSQLNSLVSDLGDDYDDWYDDITNDYNNSGYSWVSDIPPDECSAQRHTLEGDDEDC